jgi:hypothetical protein
MARNCGAEPRVFIVQGVFRTIQGFEKDCDTLQIRS